MVNADGSSSSRTAGPANLEGMMRDLGINEEDLDDVVFEEEFTPDLDENRWLLIVRVNMDREFSKFWFFKNMRSAWDLARTVKIKTLEDNLFIMKFACLGDWEKVTTGGPWHFRGNAVVFAEYDGFTRPGETSQGNITRNKDVCNQRWGIFI